MDQLTIQIVPFTTNVECTKRDKTSLLITREEQTPSPRGPEFHCLRNPKANIQYAAQTQALRVRVLLLLVERVELAASTRTCHRRFVLLLVNGHGFNVLTIGGPTELDTLTSSQSHDEAFTELAAFRRGSAS
jgi:hypothetical protein